MLSSALSGHEVPSLRPLAGQWLCPRIVDVVLVFSILFGIYFAGDVNTASVVEIILALFWLRRPMLAKGKLPVALLVILLISLTYAVAIYLGNWMLDMAYPLRFSRSVVAFCATAWFVRVVVRERALHGNAPWVYFSDILLLVLGIQAVVVLAQFTYHPLRDAIYQYWSRYPLDRLPDWRVLGLTKGGALPSLLQVLGFYLAWDKVTRRESAFPLLIVMSIGIVSLAAVFLMAQTGVIFLVVSFLPFIFISARRGGGRSGLIRAGVLFVIVVCVSAGVWWVVAVSLDETLRGNIEMSVATKTDLITTLATAGEITNPEFRDIRDNMYFWPKDYQTLLFGNSLGLREGNPADPVDRLRADTDVGYVTNIWGIGAVGLAVSMSFYLAILGFGCRAWRLRSCSGGSAMLLVASLFFLAGHAKEVHLFTRTGLEVYLLMFWAVYYSLESHDSTMTLRDSVG